MPSCATTTEATHRDKSPQRYAIHKLIVHGERPIEQRIKASEGIVQSAALLQCLVGPPSSVASFAAAWPSACALLVLELPVSEENHATWMLRTTQSFRLTEAETRVLHHFVTGAAPDEVAVRCKLSIHTVRSHMRSLFEKTGCHRQAELMRLFGGA